MLGQGTTEAGGYYSKLLQEYDAVLLSSTSMSEMLPLPTSREPGANQPLRIVIARGPDFGVDLLGLTVEDARSKVVIFTDGAEGVGSNAAMSGIETVVLEKLSLDAILDYCKRRGLLSLLIDLSGNLSDFKELLEEGVERNLLQKIIVEVLPVCAKEGVPLGISRKIKLKELKPVMCNGSVILESYL